MGAPRPPLLPLLLLLCTHRPGSSEDVKVVNALLGGEVDLKPIYTGSATGFVWKQGNNKAAEWDDPGPVSYYDALKNRCELNTSTGVLTIRNLTEADSRLYKCEALIESLFIPTQFNLRVFPILSEPNVTCNYANEVFNISCEHKPAPPTYLWWNEAGPITGNGHGYTLSNLNKTLTVNSSTPSNSLKCVVKNPATERSASLPDDCFRTCYCGKIGLIAAVIICTLVLLVGLWDVREHPEAGNKPSKSISEDANEAAEQSPVPGVCVRPETGNVQPKSVSEEGTGANGPAEQSPVPEDKMPASDPNYEKGEDHDEPGNKSPSAPYSLCSGDEKEETNYSKNEV